MITLNQILAILSDNTYITVFKNGHVLCSEYYKNVTPKFKQRFGGCQIIHMRALPDDHYMIEIV